MGVQNFKKNLEDNSPAEIEDLGVLQKVCTENRPSEGIEEKIWWCVGVWIFFFPLSSRLCL